MREAYNNIGAGASAVTWCVIQGVKPPQDQSGPREGFINAPLFTNMSSRREAMKYTLPLKTLRYKGIPLRSAWFRVAIPSVIPLYLATSSQMISRSPYLPPAHEPEVQQ